MLTVVKVGGGLGRGAGDDALRAVCTVLGELAERHPLLVVPGGAAFADAVRDHDRRFGLRATTSHRMAILGMEQFGWLLSDLIPGAERRTDLGAFADGRATVLLPAELPLDGLPTSWEVTSDSIAAWVAGAGGRGAPRSGQGCRRPVRGVAGARPAARALDGRRARRAAAGGASMPTCRPRSSGRALTRG